PLGLFEHLRPPPRGTPGRGRQRSPRPADAPLRHRGARASRAGDVPAPALWRPAAPRYLGLPAARLLLLVRDLYREPWTRPGTRPRRGGQRHPQRGEPDY